MGLKCSLLGHSFGDVDVERDREERGDEVVTVVREVERCTRCGQTRVVSENKEVTTVVEPEDAGVDRAAGAGTGFGTGGAGADAGSDASAAVDTGAGDAAGTDDDLDEYEPPEDPAEEDAEIIDDEPTEREPGQWPGDDRESFGADSLGGGADDAAQADADEGGPDERPDAAADPDAAGEAAEPRRNDDATGRDDAGSRRDDEAEILGDGPGGGRAGDRDDDATGGDVTVPEDRYVCPECGYRIEAPGSSLREGDACPECQRGYLRVENRERNS